MYTIQSGLFPFTAIVAGGLLYGVFRLWMRMRCRCRVAQAYIVAAIVATVALTFFSPYYIKEHVRPIDPMTGEEWVEEEEALAPSTVSTSSNISNLSNLSAKPNRLAPAPSLKKGLAVLNADARTLLGWIYCAGIAAILAHFFAQLVWLAVMRRRSLLIEQAEGTDIFATRGSLPFSCGRSIFMPAGLDEELRRFVLLHEQSHVRHRHFYKLCAIELLLAMAWFNPFVWLLLSELKMQHEREVDEDVLATGCDRMAYQMSLVRVAVSGSRWVMIQSHFGPHPLKLRMVFMNQIDTLRHHRRNIIAAASFSAACLALVIALGCQTHESYGSTPIDGVWTMEWFRSETDEMEYRPPLMHYNFYSGGAHLCYSYAQRNGRDMLHFTFSGCEYEWRDSAMVTPTGQVYTPTFSDSGDEHILRFTKREGQTTLAGGPNVVEKWTRIKPDEDIVYMLSSMQQAEPTSEHRLHGIWRQVDAEQDEDSRIHDAYISCWPGHFVMFRTWREPGGRVDLGGNGFMGALNICTTDSVTVSCIEREMGLDFHDDGTMTTRYYQNFVDQKGDTMQRICTTQHWQRAPFPEHMRVLLSALPKK